MTRIFAAFLLAFSASTLIVARQSVPESRVSAVDAVFTRWTKDTPGCAAGVAQNGKPVVMKAYGMADLEHDVPNRADTIFEAGSVSKQFTAAAVLLLAKDGKLSLDDPVRKHVPELPDYGAPLTVRHMLQHTSGLRDWGEVAAIAGWPRTSRVHTHAHVLDILRRQRALNFPSGTQYSYSNSGYNLAAIMVSRLSGKPFAEFSRERIFEPLGMTRTSWRDDHTRLVKDRAIAYAQSGTEFRMNMPFEDVHGNGGLLTTVEDLLKWNGNFADPKVGDGAFVKLQEEPGRFNDGRTHPYAMGLMVGERRGNREIGHSGATAGYRAHLTRFPDKGLSVAVLCNVSTGSATQYAGAVSDIFLGAAAATPAESTDRTDRPQRPQSSFSVDAKDLAAYAGEYYSEEAETLFEVAVEKEELVLKRRPDSTVRLRPTAKDEFAMQGNLLRFVRGKDGAVDELSYRGSRVFDLRFKRTTPGT